MALPTNILQGHGRYQLVEWLRTEEPCFLIARNRQNGALVVVKCFPCGLQPYEKRRLYRNVTVQWGATHPCVTRVLDFFSTRSHLCLVMEYMQGGNLDRVVERHRTDSTPDKNNLTAVVLYFNGGGIPRPRNIYGRGLVEATAKRYFCDVVHGLKVTHDRDAAHRQVTAKNVLVTGDEQHAKLNNFLCSRVGAVAASRIEVSYYTAPEIWQLYREETEAYDTKKIDVWCLGVLLFYMLFGQYPFTVPDELGAEDATRAMMEEVTTTRLAIVPGADISEDCRTLLMQMLEPQPGQRITLEGIRQSPWFTEHDPQPNGPDNLDDRLDDDVIWQLIQNGGNIENME